MSQFSSNSRVTFKRPAFEQATECGTESLASDSTQSLNPLHADLSHEYRKGLKRGHSQCDREQFADDPGRGDRGASILGLSIGLLMASIVGGAIAAFLFFEIRLDALVPNIEPHPQVLPPPAAHVATSADSREEDSVWDASVDEGGGALSNDRRSLSPKDAVSEAPAGFETESASELSNRSPFTTNQPLGLPPMGGPYDADTSRGLAESLEMLPRTDEFAPE